MFERFTDQARRVVVLAQEEARNLGHGYIGTEHILLGLLSEGEGLAAQALGALEITLDAARAQVSEIIGAGTGQPAGHIPFTPRTKKVLELSLREAQRLGDSYIGTEHILLGLAREGEGVGVQVLDRLGAGKDRVLAQILVTRRVAPGEELRRVPAGRMPAGAPISIGAVMNRLDEIMERLAAIENQLAGLRSPRPRAPRKTASGGARSGGAGRKPPAGGAEGKPPAGGAVGKPPAGGAEGKPPAGGAEPPGRAEPPAAQA
jgi:ATP-dependent Clp protease ATP-binding subunit ClpA